MNLNENTFGNSPGSMYLVRVLNELNNESLSRNIGKRITATGKNVADLVNAYYDGMSPKTVANCLRLMREEISTEAKAAFGVGKSDEALVDQLRRNVQIGYIKRAMRLCVIARKSEKVMDNPRKKSGSSMKMHGDMKERAMFFYDDATTKQLIAGVQYTYETGEVIKHVNIHELEEIQDVNSDMLMQRSIRRCKRLGKPHAANL